jgi:hypothetical protein
MKKLAIALILAIAVFSVLAAMENQKISKAAEEAAAASASLGNRAGGIVINKPSIQAPASPAPASVAVPAMPATESSGAACP